MGLFSKKECARCGNKAGLLTRKKLADDEFLCGDCVDECSPELTSDDFRSMTVDDVEEHIKSVQEDAERYRNEFVKTKIFRTQMVLKNKDILYADDTHGWWVNATRENPDVFTYDQVASCRLDLDTTEKDDDDKEKDRSLLDTLYESAALMSMRQQYPDMPIASPREQIERMEFVIYLKNRPFFSEVRIPVMDALIPSEGDIEGGYETAYQLMNFFKSLSSWSSSQQAAPAPAQAAPAASSAPAPDMADQLLKLKQLLDAGILTKDEFDAKKKQILGL